MVAFNVSVEDSSPLITYLPLEAWKDLPSDDPLIASSSGRSLHITQTQGAKAEVSFTGTGIAIYGINIADYGDYTLTVDGRDISSQSTAGISNSRKVLGSTYGLPNGLHTATLICSGSKTINIDYLDVLHEGPGSSISATVIDDSDPQVLYQPLSSWQINNATNEGFMNNTLHFSSTNGSSASLTFTGQAIAVYGTVSNDRSNLLVSLNGQTQQISVDDGPRSANSLHSKVLWYFTDALGPGQHSISLTSDVQRGTGFIDVDAFVVYSFDGNAGNGNSTSTSDTRPHSKSVPTGVIVGASVGGGVGLIILLVLLFIFLRWRKKRNTGDDIPSPVTPVLPFQRPTSFLPGGLPPAVRQRDVDQHSIAPSYYGSPLQPDSMRAGSVASSTIPILRDVPILSTPKPPSSRSTTPASDLSPIRPRRPPGPLLDLNP